MTPMKLCRFEQLTGYTPKAVQRKYQDGVWLDGYEIVKASDGNLLVIYEGYLRWVAGAPRVEFKQQVIESNFALHTEAAKSDQRSTSSRPKRT